ncbi:tetratricopeptide repeat family [Actinokineospora spheciospongiae]|uniref:Tetratricopeptide repeat family n=1 Tax=Actinokineospora spheciospongiae TaxID=909613 RepID=W7IFX6_9PSEU|nr:AAA family ATPase [Actinokineospora spheciospongiae]EWC59810.1 tetratricopeptide repeat family [Actinokineospora spheciospongiae]
MAKKVRRRPLVGGVVVGVLLLPIAVNIATDALPEGWGRFAWIGLPVSLVLTVVLAVHERRADARPAALEPLPRSPAPARDGLADRPSALLDARSAVVPFTGREPELAALTAWRDAKTTGASALLLHGPGGQGKSRLAARFAELSAADGWVVAQARHGVAPDDATGGRASKRRLLVVVDYADRWAHPELVALFADPALAGPRVRVLLIGRTVQWWAALRGELRSTGVAVGDLLLGELAEEPADRERAFTAARDRFGEVLEVPEPITEPVPDLDGPDYGQVLTLHMAALVSALTVRFPGEPMPRGVEGIAAYLLDRERMGWRRLHGTRQLGEEFDTPPTVLARAVFTAVLGGPAAHADAVARLAGLRLEPAERVLTDHRFCYPPRDRALELEPLLPDRLAEDFVALLLPGHDVTGYDPDPWSADVPRALLGLDRPDEPDPAVTARTVTVLASAADRWPHVAGRLGDLLTERPDLAVRAGSAALAALATARHLDTDVLLAVEPHFPAGRRADLDAGAAAVTDRLVRERVDDRTRLHDAASWYSRLTTRLGHAGRKAEAVRAGYRALAALDRLTELDPGAHGADRAICLMDIGGFLSDLGRHREAVEHTGRAVDLLREIGDRPALALALSNHGNQLQNTGKRGPAVAAAQESVDLHRALAGTALADPPRFAFALNGLGTRLMAVNRAAEAAGALAEGVAAYRPLVAADPQAHLPGLARALTNLGTAHVRLDAADEALRCSAEAVSIRRGLAEANPTAYRADLALSLLNHAGRLSAVGRDGEAVEVAAEAVAAARRLVRLDRIAHEPVLAHALAAEGAVLAEADRERAVGSLREAAGLYRRLALVDDGYQPHVEVVVRNLDVLGGRQPPEQPGTAAVAAFNEGVRLAQAGRVAEAAERYRWAAEAGLPQAMFNLGHLHLDGDRPVEAEAWLTRAVAAGQTAGCHDLGVLHWQRGDRGTARKWFRRGAEAGATNAMISLGASLWSDDDLDGAATWFTAAAEAGDAEGDFRLGLLRAEQDRPADARTHLERAAEAGHTGAARELADHLMRNQEVREAKGWWRVARAREEPTAEPPPAPAPPNPLTEVARERGVPVVSFTPNQGIEFAAAVLARTVGGLLAAGRVDDALAAYRESIDSHGRLLAGHRAGKFPMGDDMLHSVLRRCAMTKAELAHLEHDAGHGEAALAHSEEAVAELGALSARIGDALSLARAQLVFAFVRQQRGVDTERAAEVIAEAVAAFTRLVSAHPEAVRDLKSAWTIQGLLGDR